MIIVVHDGIAEPIIVCTIKVATVFVQMIEIFVRLGN